MASKHELHVTSCNVVNGRIVITGPEFPGGLFIYDSLKEITEVEKKREDSKIRFSQGGSKFATFYCGGMIYFFKEGAEDGYRILVREDQKTSLRMHKGLRFCFLPGNQSNELIDLFENLRARIIEKYKACHGVNDFDKITRGTKKDSLG